MNTRSKEKKKWEERRQRQETERLETERLETARLEMARLETERLERQHPGREREKIRQELLKKLTYVVPHYIEDCIRDNDIDTFDMILKEKSEEVLELRDCRDVTLFHFVGRHGRVNLGVRLLEYENDINVANRSGFTPLMEAARNGNKEFVQWMLSNGASLLQKDCYGENAIDWAKRGNNDETVTFLQQYINDNGMVDDGMFHELTAAEGYKKGLNY